MMLNRLFRTQQRMHELVLYDYLFRYYNSMQAREKKNADDSPLTPEGGIDTDFRGLNFKNIEK